MSTRSIIAVPDPARIWKGVYHHSDGYPSGLGCYLPRVLDALEGDVDRFRALVIDAHPLGWSHLFPGQRPDHAYSGKCPYGRDYEKCRRLCGEVSCCYCHDPYFSTRGDNPDDPQWFWGDECEGAFDTDTEWFYLVTPDGILTRKIERVEGPAFSSKLGRAFTCMRDAVAYGYEEEIQRIGALKDYDARKLTGFKWRLPTIIRKQD